MTHADQLITWLQSLGYTHCFFVSGGNSMHLLNAARQKMTCIPVVHEVSGGIAAEYFNESNLSGGKAFVLVTAGPGLTNLVTALAGAFLESRELLGLKYRLQYQRVFFELKNPSHAIILSSWHPIHLKAVRVQYSSRSAWTLKAHQSTTLPTRVTAKLCNIFSQYSHR